MMGKKQDRKKEKQQNKYYDRMWKEIEGQGFRVKEAISKFYPDGVLAEFSEHVRVGKAMADSPVVRHFTEDNNAWSACSQMAEEAKARGSSCIDIDFFKTYMCYRGRCYSEYHVRAVFKVNPEDSPVYVHSGYGRQSVNLRFLLDSTRKKAFLVIDKLEDRNSDVNINAGSGFTDLCEFYAILAGFDVETDRFTYFLVSFSKEDRRCVVEEVSSLNEWGINNVLGVSEYDSHYERELSIY